MSRSGASDNGRFVYIASFPGMGGTQEYTFMLARKMVACAPTTLIMPFDEIQERQFGKPFRALGGETVTLPQDLCSSLSGRSYIGRISAGFHLRRIIRNHVAFQPKRRLVLHTNLNPIALAALAVAADASWIIVNTFHDFGSLGRRSISFLPNTIALDLLSRRRSAFIVPSGHIADDLVTKVAAVCRDRVHVIHTGIDPLPAREVYSAVPPLRFGMIGRVVEAKAPDVWIKAIARFLNEGGCGEFHWFGQGPDLEAARQEVTRVGIGDVATFHGYIDDARRALDSLDVFVLSSRWEGGCLPRSVLEAMFRCVPCLLPSLPSIVEAIGERDCALFYDAEDPASLARGLAAASATPGALLIRARAARELVMSDHTADAEFAATIALYREKCDGN